MLRLWGVGAGELPDCSQWHLASRVLRLRSEPLTSDHTHSSDLHTSLRINEKRYPHVSFICNILTSTLMKTICLMNTLLLEMMQINQGSVFLSVGIFYILFKSISVCSIWSKMVQCAALLYLTCASVKHKMPSVVRDKQEQL